MRHRCGYLFDMLEYGRYLRPRRETPEVRSWPVADLPVSPLPTYCVEKLADKSEAPRFIPEIKYKLYLLELS